MLGCKFIKPGWDKSDCMAGTLWPDWNSSGMLKMQGYSIGTCTQIIWASAPQAYGAGMRGECQWTPGATAFHSPLSSAWLMEETHLLYPVTKLMVIVVKCHKTIFCRPWGHAVLASMFVHLCILLQGVSCVSEPNTPSLPSESCWFRTHLLFRTTVWSGMAIRECILTLVIVYLKNIFVPVISKTVYKPWCSSKSTDSLWALYCGKEG